MAPFYLYGLCKRKLVWMGERVFGPSKADDYGKGLGDNILRADIARCRPSVREYGIQKLTLLLQFEGHGKVVLHAYGLTVVTAGLPFRHLLHYADGFFVESGVFLTNHLHVGDSTVFFNNECHYNTSGNAFFGGSCGVNDVVAEPFIESSVTTGEGGFLFYDGHIEDSFVFGLFFNLGLFNNVVDYCFRIHVFNTFNILRTNCTGVFLNFINSFNLFGLVNFFNEVESSYLLSCASFRFRNLRFWFFKLNEIIFRFRFRFFFLVHIYNLLLILRINFFIGSFEHTGHYKNQACENYCENAKHDNNSEVVTFNRA